jgi:hypothetical protein
MESLLPEPTITQQRTSEVADPDQDGFPVAINPELVSNRGDQLGCWIADSRLAKIPEAGQVLADLGVAHADRFAEQTTSDLHHTVSP